MERVIEELQHEIKYNHLPYGRRIASFLWRKRWRFIVIAAAGSTFTYWANPLGFLAAKTERTFKRYKRRLILHYFPVCMTYQTAIETTWEPTKLSRVSTERLGEMFVRLDRDLPHGVTRQLILDVLLKMNQ